MFNTVSRCLPSRKRLPHRAARRLRVEPLEDRRLLDAAPLISEFMASNRTALLDEDNQSSDWIELVNAGDQPVDLAGWYLTDNPGNLAKWTFPSVNLAPGDYLTVFASNKDRAVAGAELHTNFSLQSEGEFLALVQPDGVTIANQFGSVQADYPIQWRDVSYGITDTGNQGTRLVGSADEASYLVPGDDSVDASWMTPEFDDTAWPTGANGFNFGVDTNPPIEPTAYNQAVLADNPLLYWTFDEPGDTDPARSLANDTPDNVMAPQGGASRAASTTTLGGVSLGRAASISGTGSMFFAPDLFGDPTPGNGNGDPGFDFIASQQWAVEFWLNTSGASNQYISEVFDGAGTSNNPAMIYNFSGGPKLEMFSAGGRWGVAPVASNQWRHVVAAFYGNSGGFGDNLRELYVDGELTQDTTSTFSAGHGLGKMSIGNATNGNNPISGLIDEYAIYELGTLPDLAARQARVADIVEHRNVVPTPAPPPPSPPPSPPPPEAMSAYNQAVLADNPLKYWTFDEPGGPAVNIVSPSDTADQLNPQGAATRVAHDALGSGLSLGNAAEFDGTDGTHFRAADLSGVEVGTKWAVEMWVQMDNSVKTTYFFESGLNDPALIHGFGGNGLELFGGGRTGSAGPQTLADGQWHHVVVGNDTVAGEHTIIIDGGTPQKFLGVTSQFALSNLGVGAIGRDTSVVNVLDGRIDELAIYDLSGAADFAASLAGLADHFYLATVAGADLETEMYDVNSTLYTRFDFQVEDKSVLERLSLRMKYDDGFAAYLNGTLVASANAPSPLAWNSTAMAPRPDDEVYVGQYFDVSSAIPLLLDGGANNVLAIQGLNVASDDEDFLLSAQLFAFDAFTVSPDESYFLSPTPGAPNGQGLPESGPTITGVFEPAAAPSDGTDLAITAAVAPDAAAINSVTLAYRANYNAEVTLPMLDDGTAADAAASDGIYTAVIPASASGPGDMVRWYVTADDTQGNESRAPMFLVADNAPEYFGTVIADPTVSSNLPVFEWFLAPGTEAAARGSGTRASAYYRGRFYDNIFVRSRGESIKSTGKYSFKVSFNQHHDFVYDANEKPVSEFDLNSTGMDKSYIRPVLGFEFMRDAGLAYSLTFPMHVRRNGDFYSVALFVEHPEDDYLERNGLDPEGALYKGALNGFTLQAQGSYRDVNNGFDKQTRQWEDNADMVEFVTGLEQTGEAQTRFVLDNVNLPGVVNYMAAGVILQDADRLVDNYYAYRDTRGTGEWTMLPWDLDLSQGQTNTNSDDWDADEDFPIGLSHPFYGARAYYQGHPALWNKLIDVVVTTPQFREMYLRRLRTLMDDFLGAPGTPQENLYFEGRIDELYGLMADDVLLDEAIWGDRYGAAETFQYSLDRLKNEYYAVRRTHLFITHTAVDGVDPGDTTVLISGDAGVTSARYFVPSDNTFDDAGPTEPRPWTTTGFVDTGWDAGTTGIGYEDDSPANFNSLITTRAKPQETIAGGTSIYVRIPLSIDNLAGINDLTLRMKYDDGFVAYLNGTEVARRNVDGTPAWDSTATANIQSDDQAVVFENIDVSAYMGLLTEGSNNVLAVQVVNVSDTSSDLLVLPELVEGVIVGNPGSGDSAGIPAEQDGNPAIGFSAVVFNPASGNQDEEYIELVNGNTAAVDVSGWRLDDAVEWTFSPGTVIPANSSLFVSPDVTAFRARTNGPSGGQGLFAQGNYRGHLSNFGETIRLFADDGTQVAEFTYQGDPTPAQQFLRISEVMYNPADLTPREQLDGFVDPDQFEFIELVNTGPDAALDLTGVRFTDGVLFDFTGSAVTSLAPGERVLVVRDEAAMNYRYPDPDISLLIAGQYTGGLKNDGETVKLEDATHSTVAEFTYKDGPQWPRAADGGGKSLVPVALNADLNAYESWYAGVEEGGSPGAAAAAAVIARHVFYDGSSFDPGGTAGDDAAVATDKTALLPGQTATTANFTNYSGGVNGLMFDLAHADAAASIDADDLALAIGNNGDSNTWQTITATSIDVRQGGGRGGSDRVVLTWPDSPVKNTWLQVSVLSSGPHTGLLEDDVFYFGNAVGQTGNDALNALVNAADVISIRDNPRGALNPASIDNPRDVNRDQFVDAVDLILARNNATGPLTALRLIGA